MRSHLTNQPLIDFVREHTRTYFLFFFLGVLFKILFSPEWGLVCYAATPLALQSPPSFKPTRFDDGILPTPHFSTRFPSPSSLRSSGSFPMRSDLPQQASSTPVTRSSPSTLGAHPLSFSSLTSPQFSKSSPHPSPVLASLPIPSPPLPSLLTLLASLQSLLFHLRQVAQCFVSCPFLTDIACHYVSLCMSLIFLLFPFYFLLRLGSQPEIQECSLS